MSTLDFAGPPPETHSTVSTRECQAYFDEVAHDYQAWSPDYNMHFGYWRLGINPLRRESMLVRMNLEVGAALRLPEGPAAVVDLGCGASAVARTLTSARPDLYAVTVSNVPRQHAIARQYNRARGVDGRIACVLADYRATGLPAASADGAWALESACYDEGPAKTALVREAARLLKPGARLVVTDGFLMRERMNPVAAWIHRFWADSWAVPQLAERDAFIGALRQAGFVNIEVRSLRWRVAASALHIPWLASWFALRELVKARGRLTPWRRKHILASYCSLLLGVCWRDFDYLMITAERGA